MPSAHGYNSRLEKSFNDDDVHIYTFIMYDKGCISLYIVFIYSQFA